MTENRQADLEIPLLRTKLSIPLLPPEFVHRPRLTELINRGVQRPLTLVSAPAGFGKTNLLIDWAVQSPVTVTWLTLDRQDNELGRFVRYLTGALRAVDPRVGLDALDFLRSTQSDALEMGLTLLVNDIAALPRDVVLVIDEYQVIDDPSIGYCMDFLLAHGPARLRCVITCRGEPALNLAYLRAKGRVTEVRADDLRFTIDEVVRFFELAAGLRLSGETIRAIEASTEGWVTALQLAALSLRDNLDPSEIVNRLRGDAHYLVDYLSEQVLNRQPPDVREFLLRTSVLNVLTGPLCDAVTDPQAPPGHGTAMLARLESANLFTAPLDRKHEWYRYHQLFAAFLQHILEEELPEEIPVLHRRAAVWLQLHGDYDEAFGHALATGDSEFAASLMERSLESLIRVGDLQVLLRWGARLPEEVLIRHPRLGVGYAWSLTAAYHLDDAGAWLQKIGGSLPNVSGEPGAAAIGEAEDDGGLWSVRGGYALCSSMFELVHGDVEDAARLSRAAMEYLPKDSPFVHSTLALEDCLYHVLLGDTVAATQALRETVQMARAANNLLVYVVAICKLADMQALQGHMTQAFVTLQKAQYAAVDAEGRRLPLGGMADICAGGILLERNQLDEARERLERGVELAKSWWLLGGLGASISLTRVYQCQGDVASAEKLIERAARLALSTDSSTWDDIYISAIAARVALQRRDLAVAAQWLWKSGLLSQEGIGVASDFPYHVREYVLLTQARFCIAMDRESGGTAQSDRAADTLETLLPDAVRFERMTSRIEILILQALVWKMRGDLDAATSTFCSALALGEPEGYRRIFLDEAPEIVPLLTLCRRTLSGSAGILPSPSYIDSLLAAIEPASARPAESTRSPRASFTPEVGPPESLSPRELEVLRLVAQGKSNREISAALFLALNTVKRHVYNIYTKLGVEKRTQAVAKARALRLID